LPKQDEGRAAPLIEVLPPNSERQAIVPVPSPSSASGQSRFARWRRWVLLLMLVLAAGGAAWFTWWRPAAVTVIHPWRGLAIEAVYATGIVEAVDTARIGTTVAARIVALMVDEGDSVREGQVVAQLDDSQARHRQEDAVARLVQAEQELSRGRDLLARGVKPRQDVERAQEAKDQAAAAVRLSTRQVEEHRIRAPLDGVVMKRPVKVGETVAAHETLFEVVSGAHLRVAAEVDERDIPLVRMGADVAIRSEAFTQEAFRARITNIRLAGETTTRTFRVEADLPRDTKLLTGMTVDVNIVTAERPNALLVPALSVRNDPPTGGRPGAAYVFQAEGGRAVRVPVEIGASGAEATEIRWGLSDSTAVIAAPSQTLTDGTRIRVTGEQALAR
jgi:RND family efflux transporter MFP subunit